METGSPSRTDDDAVATDGAFEGGVDVVGEVEVEAPGAEGAGLVGRLSAGDADGDANRGESGVGGVSRLIAMHFAEGTT